MKKIFLAVFALASLISFGQGVSIKQELREFSTGKAQAFVLEIPYAKVKVVQEEFAKSFRKKATGEITRSGNEFLIPGLFFPEVWSDTFDIQSIVYEGVENTVLVVRFKSDSVGLLETIPEVNRMAFRQMLSEFANDVYLAGLDHLIDLEKDELKRMEKDEKKKTKQYNRREKGKSKNERSIYKLKVKIEDNDSEVALISKEIEGLRKILITENPTEEYAKELEKKIKDLEKSRKKLIKSNESLYREIDDLESENRNLDREMEKITKDIEYIRSLLVEQDQKVKDLKNLYKTEKRK